jgi:NAD(P)-dependent dehydrogenase (short-subunit alcohol dehydrogenase family)
VDIVVNNAGILRDKIIWNMTEEDFDAVIRVHLKGTFSTIKHAVTHWRAKHKAGEPVYGRIINTASAAMLGNPGQANYSAAKGAIASLTLTVAVETQAMGVTCNAIRPSAATRMTQMVSARCAKVKDGFDARDPGTSASSSRTSLPGRAVDLRPGLFGLRRPRLSQQSWHNAAKMETPTGLDRRRAGVRCAEAGRQAPRLHDGTARRQASSEAMDYSSARRSRSRRRIRSRRSR